jgi:hypothetical protein
MTRSVVYTGDEKHPRIVFEITCDTELLTACIKDNDVKPDQILVAVKRTMEAVNAAIVRGKTKAKAEAEEV